MLRLPPFEYRAAGSIDEAATLLASAPGRSAIVAGGTDLLPNMKRRQQTPSLLVGISGIPGLRQVDRARDLSLGAGVTLAELVRDPMLRLDHAALWQAAAQVATPQIRTTATIGGNICLDTRCNYYDQTFEWRKSIGFCLKRDGDTCWVAPGSRQCLAVSSTDTAPALIALGASVTLVSPRGPRDVALSDFYRRDGIDYLVRRQDEILTTIRLPRGRGWRSAYWKLRRRGSFDFPVLSVAAAVQLDEDGIVRAARIVLGSAASCPIVVTAAADTIIGAHLEDEAIAAAADAVSRPARPMDNTDFSLHWRKRMAAELARWALREVRGDDVTQARVRLARRSLNVA